MYVLVQICGIDNSCISPKKVIFISDVEKSRKDNGLTRTRACANNEI